MVKTVVVPTATVSLDYFAQLSNRGIAETPNMSLNCIEVSAPTWDESYAWPSGNGIVFKCFLTLVTLQGLSWLSNDLCILELFRYSH